MGSIFAMSLPQRRNQQGNVSLVSFQNDLFCCPDIYMNLSGGPPKMKPCPSFGRNDFLTKEGI